MFLEAQYETPKRKIFGDLSNGSPVSPMANLKLLTKVATSSKIETPGSPAEIDLLNKQIRKKVCSRLTDHAIGCEASMAKESFEFRYVRKNKSLSVLCEK